MTYLYSDEPDAYGYSYHNFITDCNLFNTLANKVQIPSKKDLREQLELIREELAETIRDLDAEDYVGVLDGYTDLMVTVAGLGQQLEVAGFATLEALQATAQNNLTKFVEFSDNDTIINTLDMYGDKDMLITAERNLEYNTVVFKDMHNKVRKPYGFVSNDLTEFVPVKLEIKEE